MPSARCTLTSRPTEVDRGEQRCLTRPDSSSARQLSIGAAPDWRHLESEFYAEEGTLAYWPYNRFGLLGGDTQVTMMILTPGMPSLPDSRKPKIEKPATSGR